MSLDHERIAKLFKTQQSLTEWLEDINHDDAKKIKIEDNKKRERLKVLNGLIGLPVERVVKFRAVDLRDNSEEFKKYYEENKDRLCAFRLLPLEGDLPKLRMRGKSVKDAYEWFKEQDIDADKYDVDCIDHPDGSMWAGTFVVLTDGIFGEVVQGGHHQLTQGFYDSGKPISFVYDFENLKLSEVNEDAEKFIIEILSKIEVSDSKVKEEVNNELEGEFSNNYLLGYFEVANSKSNGIEFIDYNKSLGEKYIGVDINNFVRKSSSDDDTVIVGLSASNGVAEGTVKIVNSDEISDSDFNDGDVLVCGMTSPDYLPLMQRASAIVTDQGGILSHAAIVARELKKPCLVATGDATKKLKNGDKITVDASNGKVVIKK